MGEGRGEGGSEDEDEGVAKERRLWLDILPRLVIKYTPSAWSLLPFISLLQHCNILAVQPLILFHPISKKKLSRFPRSGLELYNSVMLEFHLLVRGGGGGNCSSSSSSSSSSISSSNISQIFTTGIIRSKEKKKKTN